MKLLTIRLVWAFNLWLAFTLFDAIAGVDIFGVELPIDIATVPLLAPPPNRDLKFFEALPVIIPAPPTPPVAVVPFTESSFS